MKLLIPPIIMYIISINSNLNSNMNLLILNDLLELKKLEVLFKFQYENY